MRWPRISFQEKEPNSTTPQAYAYEYAGLRIRTAVTSICCHVTEDALVYAAKLVEIELTVEKGTQRIQAFLSIKAWPDALPALRSLKASGMKMALPSNFTPAMLDAVRSSGLH